MSDPIYYETMYILRPDIPEEEVESHITKYSDLLKNADVDVLDSQMRGKRRLAYPIGKHKEGVYVQLSHKGDGQQVAVLERAMRLSEDVIRYLTVKQEGPLPTPKPSQAESKKAEGKENKKEDSPKLDVKENKKEDSPKLDVKENKKETSPKLDVKENKKETSPKLDVKENKKETSSKEEDS